MNAKQIGQAVRRGVLVGALTGFLAGWVAFATNSGSQPTVVDAAVKSDGRLATVVAREVPPVPPAPTLAPLPTPIAALTASLKKAPPPPAIPTLQPLPPLPNVQVAVHTTTRTS
ncbi:MAG TPA: hypothetical protein VNG11_03415 [Chloroflexota bacterium]|nr:hypothetical protein [Chloroflexota bacterium]